MPRRTGLIEAVLVLSILGTPASLGKMAFTSEMGDEVGARRVGSEGRDQRYLCKWSEKQLPSGKASSSRDKLDDADDCFELLRRQSFYCKVDRFWTELESLYIAAIFIHPIGKN